MSIPVEDLADRLYRAARRTELVDPLTDEHPDLTMEAAYEIQDAVVARYEADGDAVVGAKLGLTSRAKQRDVGVHEPLYGWLTASLDLDPGTPLDLSAVGQPRVEPEIAFRLGEDLEGAHVNAVRVLAATEWVAPSLEVLDSRYCDYRFTLVDVVADNASSGRYLVGGVPRDPAELDLRLVGCVLERNGVLEATAAGAACLGHPATAVAWLARALAARGTGLAAGSVVISGGLTAAVAVGPGDVVTADFDRLGSVELACRGPVEQAAV